ncbi:MAG: hypothetical protein BYD32DRAFT_418478 [Podila humilis]|nr:MAG: hypothetical protein BYD32DRAFT_418478 [Podila humilis]
MDPEADQRLAEQYNELVDLLRQHQAGANLLDDPPGDGDSEDGEMYEEEEDEEYDPEAHQKWRHVDPVAFYRFSWEEINHLIILLRFPEFFRTESRLCMPTLEAFCFSTYRLSHTSRWMDIGILFPQSRLI